MIQPKTIHPLRAWGFVMLCASMLAWGCDSYEPYPRKRAYHRIDMPDSAAVQLTQLAQKTCPFTFAYPADGEIARSSSDSCWVNIYFPKYDCTWHITYRDIVASRKPMDFHFEEFRRLVYEHSKKSTKISHSDYNVPAGGVTAYEIFGNVGTPAQYFVVDSQLHKNVILSVYFQTALRNDSLAPVIDYMKRETRRAVRSLQWQ